MKRILALLFLVTTACASNPYDAHYKQEKNAPKFGNTRSYIEPASGVKLAARAALDELTHESDPPTNGSIKEENDETLSTGWVYGESKNQYVEYKANGLPQRKALKTRRKYSYSITPSLAGTQVVMEVEEEVMKVDLKTGKDKGWSRNNPDPALYDQMNRLLQEKLRAL
jgi:hypothetical protein